MNKKLLLTLCLTAVLLFAGCGEDKIEHTATGYYFDTVINFSFYGEHGEEAIDACMGLAQTYDDLWNKNKADSEISLINASEGFSVTVSEETKELLTLSLTFADETNGLVTPTIGALSSLWDFKSENPSLPEEESLKQALEHIDPSCLSMEENTVTLTDPFAKVDPGFIAKGFAADKMKELAVSLGVTSGFINLGGNVLVIGQKPDGTAFHIGIQDPEKDATGAITTVDITDESVVTSGVYERSFTLDGMDYYHILDTKTGYPVRNNLLSVSVIGPSSAICDGLSTTLFVLGEEEGREFLKQYEDYRAIFITDDLSIHTSY